MKAQAETVTNGKLVEKLGIRIISAVRFYGSSGNTGLPRRRLILDEISRVNDEVIKSASEESAETLPIGELIAFQEFSEDMSVLADIAYLQPDEDLIRIVIRQAKEHYGVSIDLSQINEDSQESRGNGDKPLAA